MTYEETIEEVVKVVEAVDEGIAYPGPGSPSSARRTCSHRAT